MRPDQTARSQMKLSDFAGDWKIARQIDDRRADRVGTLSGTAQFVPDSEGLIYVEEGILRFPGNPDLEAHQRYHWRSDGDAIEVRFQNGRPFHGFDLSGDQPSARHDCDPDTYLVAYDFHGWPDWSAQWSVTGPRKDHVIRTHYRRLT